MSAKPLFPPLPDYPPSIHLILNYVDRDLEAKLIQLGKDLTHFNNQTGRYERQYGILFVHDQREGWPLVDMHDSLPVLILRLVEDIQVMLEQKLTQTIINGYLRGRGISLDILCVPSCWVSPQSCGSKMPSGVAVLTCNSHSHLEACWYCGMR